MSRAIARRQAGLTRRGRLGTGGAPETAANSRLPARSRLCSALLLALGYAGAAGANNIVPDGRTVTTKQTEADGSTSIHTDTTNGAIGFNSFSDFAVSDGSTVNLHHAANTEHLVNLVHDSRAVIDGTVNSLTAGGDIGGHLVFADPHGIVVGASGTINAGRLSLTTPTEGFLDEVVAPDGTIGAAAASDLVNNDLDPADIATDADALIRIEGDVNATRGVHLRAGRVNVTSGAAIESGTANAVDALEKVSEAVNIEGVEAGVAAEATDGRITIVAETDRSIADGRTGEPLEDASTPPTDDEFAVSVSGRLAASRSDGDAEPSATGVHVEGRDVRVSGTVASVNGDENVHEGGQVTIRATDDPNADPDASRAANVDIAGSVEARDVAIEGRRIALDGDITADALAPAGGSLNGDLRIDAARDIVGGATADARLDAYGGIDLEAGGDIRPESNAFSLEAGGGITLDSGGDIGSATADLELDGEALQVDAEGTVDLELTGDVEIADLAAGGAVHLRGTEDVTYGRITAGSTLELGGFDSVLGDGGLRADAGTSSLLGAAGTLTIDADTIAAATGFIGTTRVAGEAGIELQAQTINLAEVDAGTYLDAEGRRYTTLGTVTSGADQTYTDGAGNTGSVVWNELRARNPEDGAVGDVAIDVGGDVIAGDIEQVGDVTIDVGGDVIVERITGDGGLTVTGAMIDVGTVDTVGNQDYTGDILFYRRLEAGTWTGDAWGEGTRATVSNIDADIAGVLREEVGSNHYARATGAPPNLVDWKGIEETDGGTATTVNNPDGTVVDITTDTTSTNGEIGFNSFNHFQVASGQTANMHLPTGANHLVNIVHESEVKIDGTVNALVGGNIGGHLLFADPHGMVVGPGGTINAGRLSLTTPDAGFLDGVVAGYGAIDTVRANALIDTNVTADRFEDNTITFLNGAINTVSSVNLRGHRIRVGPGGTIEAGTETAVDAHNAGDAVSTYGRIVIEAETTDSIARGRARDRDPLGDPVVAPVDEEFAVSIDGRLAVARSGAFVTGHTGVVIKGTDVRVGELAEIDARGSATVAADHTVTDVGGYAGGDVRIAAESRYAPDDALWDPVNPIARDGNLDLAGDIAAFGVSADARYIDVSGDVDAAYWSGNDIPDFAEGGITLSAVSERYSMWGVVPVDAGIRVDGRLAGHALDLSAYARATSGIAPDDEVVDLPGSDAELDGYRKNLHEQAGELRDDDQYFGVALVADADASIDIGATAELDATTTMDITSVAKREVKTDRLFQSFFTGTSMAHGELRGDTRVHIADGASLSAGDDIRLTGVSDNDLNVRSLVFNAAALLPVSFTNFALSYARGDVDTDTAVTVDHGVRFGDATDPIHGLDLRAETRNDVRVTAKSYSFGGTGIAGALALQFTDTDTRAALHADVTADDDVNVAARSITEYNSTFTDASIGLNPLAASQILVDEAGQFVGEDGDVIYATNAEGTFEGDVAAVASLSPEELFGSIGGAATSSVLSALGVGVGFGVGISEMDNSVSATIGPQPLPALNGSTAYAPAPTIKAGGNVAVHAERVMKDVHVAGGAGVGEGLGLSSSTASISIGVAYTDIVNDANALVGAGTTIEADRVGINAVSDVPMGESFEKPESIGDFLDKHFNVCAGICTNVTSYTAAFSSPGLDPLGNTGVTLSGNVNWWEHENKASAQVGAGAEITARAPRDADAGWQSVLPGGPLPGPHGFALQPVTLAWRDEIDVRSYARVEEVHVAGMFRLLGTFLGTAFGNGGNALGGSLNRLDYDIGSTADVADDARLTALDPDDATAAAGDIGVRARTDELIVAVNPSAGASTGGSSVAGNITAGLVDIVTDTRATVASAARLTGHDVTVAADHQLSAWDISGGLLSSSASASVGISLAGLDVDGDVIARVGDDRDADADRPASGAEQTVTADDLTVRSRAYGDVGAVGIQVKMPGINANMDPRTASRSGKITKRLQGAKGALGKLGPLAPLANLIASPSTMKSGRGGVGFSASLAGASGFSTVDINTDAALRNVAVGGHGGDPIDDVNIVARREFADLSIAGSAGIGAVASGAGSPVSLNTAVTVGLNVSGGRTAAVVEGARIGPVADLDVIASRGDGGMVAGLGASAQVGSSPGFQAAISASLHLDDTTTRAAVLDSAVTTTANGDMDVLAFDTSRVTVGSGAGTFGSTSGGLGLTMGFSLGKRTIAADVADSDLTIGGDLDVRARRLTQTIAVGAAVGGGKEFIKASGSAATIVALDTVRAAITDSQLEVGGDLGVATTLDLEGLEFRHADAGLGGRDARRAVPAAPEGRFNLAGVDYLEPAQDAIPNGSGAYDLSIAGGLSANSGNGASAAAALNVIDNTITARVARTQIDGAPTAVNVRAVDESRASAIAVAGNVSSGLSASLTVAGNHVASTLTAELFESSIERDGATPADWGDGNVEVVADDRTDVHALALSATGSGSSGAGAALSLNSIASSRTARIHGEKIEAADVTVRALARGLAKSWAFGMTGSSGGLAAAGSVPINWLVDSVTATIDGGAEVEARDSVVVEAAAEQRSQVLAGAAGIASGVGIAGTVPINRLKTTVAASIGDGADESTRVTAHALDLDDERISMRTGEVDEEPELQRFETVKMVEDDNAETDEDDDENANKRIEGLDGAGPGTLEPETEQVRGVGVGAVSLQGSSTVGGTLGGGAGGLGLGLAMSIGAIAGETTSDIRNASVTAGGTGTPAAANPSVDVVAASQVWTADIAVVGAASTGGAGGAGFTMARVDRTTAAEVEDAVITAQGAFDVDAKTRIGTSLMTIGVSGAGGVGVAAQAGLVRHDAETRAKVIDTSVDAAGLDIASDADNGALLAVGSGGFGVGAGAGIAGGVLRSSMDTDAVLRGGDADTIEVNGGDVSVTADTDSDLRNTVAGIAGGSVAGVAGSVTYSEFANDTRAGIEGNAGTRLRLGTEDAAIDDLTVRAYENVRLRTGAGSLGIGAIGAGVGGAAAMVVGRSTVDATVKNASVYADSAIDIDAERDLRIRTQAASAAGGAVGALAGGVSLIVLGDTGIGALDEELNADGDGSAALVEDDLSPGADDLSGDDADGGDDAAEGDTEASVDEGIQDDFESLFGGDPTLFQPAEDRARVRIDNAHLHAGKGIDVDATTRIGTKARAGAGAIGGGAGAGVGVARTALAGQTRVEVVNGSRLETGDLGFVELSAEGLDHADYGALDIAVTSGAAAGILSFGGSWVHGENAQTTVIDVDDSYVETGHARIAARNDQSAEAKAYAGSVAAVTGFATRVELDLASTARVDIHGALDIDADGEIDPWRVGGLDVDARNDLAWDHQALGTGIGGVSFGGAQAYADLAATSDVELGDGLAVTLPRQYRTVGAGIRVHARNVLAPFGDKKRVAVSYAGGLIAGAFPNSETTVANSADVTIGDDVMLDGRGGDPDGRGGDLVIGAANALTVTDHVRSVAGGALFAASAGDLRADVTGTVEQSVSIGAGARLIAARDLVVSTGADLDIDTGVNASGGGLGAKATADGAIDLDIGHRVEVDRSAELGGLRDIVLDAGAASDSEVALDTRAYTQGVGGKAVADATVDLEYDTALDIGVGSGAAGAIRAGRDVRLVADAGAVDAEAHWETTSSALFVPIRDSGGAAQVAPQEDFTLAMPVEAGYLNDIRIEILPDGETTADGHRFTVTDGDGQSIREELLAWTRISLADGFNPYQSVKERSSDADTNTAAILEGVLGSLPDQDVYTVEIGDLAASAGNIVIDAGSHDDGVFSGVDFKSGASLTASGDPAIDLVNDSSRFLRLLGDIRLRGGDGGAVTVAGQSLGDDVAVDELPGPVTVARETADGGELRVNVSNTLDPVDGTAPALFVEGAIANPAGVVRLHNAGGDLVQYDAVIARTIDIDVPEGTFTVSNPPGGFWPANNALGLAADYRDALGLFDLSADLVDILIKYNYYPDIESLCCNLFDLRKNTVNIDGAGDPGFASYSGDPLGRTDGSLLRARWIGIDAEYIDLDTDIEAGRASELSVDLGSDVLSQILEGQTGSGYVDLDVGDDEIAARYNRATGRIELERMTGSGPGGVYLNGHIMSSVSNADITVNRGAADIDIDNSTGIPIELVDIDAGTPGSAVVKITDEFRTNGDGTLTTWYVDGTEFENDLAQRETRRYETRDTYAHWSDAVADLRDGDPATGPLEVTGQTDVYSPKSGVGFRVKRVWRAEGTGLHEDDNVDDFTRDKKDNIPDPLVTWDRAHDDPIDWIGDFQHKRTQVTVRDISDKIASDSQYERHRQTQVRGYVDADVFNCGGAITRCNWDYNGFIDWAKFKEIEYIRADADVGVGFTGGAGGIDVDSNAAVHLAGSVDNPSGATTVRAVADDATNPAGWAAADGAGSTVGIFSAANAARLDGLRLTLEATDSIGVAGDGGAVRVGGRSAVDAVSHQGSVYLQGATQADDALRLERVHADKGQVSIDHPGALVNAEAGSGAVVRAGAIDLDAERIGSGSDRLRIELTDADLRGGAGDRYIANAVNAQGVTGVHLNAVSGDLLIGHIATTSQADGAGDISLVASGADAGIRAASNRETDFEDVVDDSKAIWKGLGLIDDGDGSNDVGIDALRARDVASFETNVKQAYREHWRLSELVPGADELVRNPDQEIDIDLAADSAAYDYFKALSGATDLAGVEAYVEDRVAAIRTVYADAFPDGSLPALSEDYADTTAFDYNAADHTIDDGRSVAQARRERHKAWTLQELAAPLPADAQQAVAGSVLDNTPVHIAATGDVTLEAAGNIGRVLSEEQFSVTNDWTLPEDARAAVLTAGAGDITCSVGGFDGEACSIDEDTNRFDFAAHESDDPNDDTTFAFTIQQRQVLRVDAQGTLDATTTGGSALLGDGDADDGLTIGTIDAADELRLLSTAAITADTDSGRLLDAGDGLWMTSATGAIGTTNDPITVAVDGAVQNAVGSGGVYLEAARSDGHGGTLTLNRLAASGGGTIGLSGGDNDYVVERGDGAVTTLTGSFLDLDYTGTFGTWADMPEVSDGLTVRGSLTGSGRLVGAGAVGLDGLSVADSLVVAAETGVTVANEVDANWLATSGSTFELKNGADLDVATAAQLVFSEDIDIAGRLDAETLVGITGAFNQSGDSRIAVDRRATINATLGDIVVADLRSAGEGADAIELDAEGRIATNGTSVAPDGSTRPDLRAEQGRIVLDAGEDIGADSDHLVLDAATLEARAGDSAYIELLGDTDIADLTVGDSLGLRGSGEPGSILLDYGRLDAEGSLSIAGFDQVRGDGRLRTDGGSDALMSAGGRLEVVDVGKLRGADGFGGDNRLVSDAAIDIAADVIDVTELDAGTSLKTVATTRTTLANAFSDGIQSHTDGASDGGRFEWTGVLDAGGAITVDVGGNVVGGDVDGDATLALTGANVVADRLSTVGDQTLTGSDYVHVRHITTETGALEARANRIRMSSSSVETGGKAMLVGEAEVSIGSLKTTEGADALLQGDDIWLDNANIAGDLRTVARDRTELHTVKTGGDQTHKATGEGGDVQADALTAGGSIVLDGADKVHAWDLDLQESGSLTIDGGRLVEVQETDGGNAQTLRSTGDVDFGQLDAGGPITLDAGGAVTGGVFHDILEVAGAVDSGGTLTVTAGANIGLTDVSATGAQTLQAAGDVTAERITGGDTLAVNGAAIDITTVDTAGGQRYTGDSLAYGTLEAGTWSGEAWGEGEVDRSAGIAATGLDSIDGGRMRATGKVKLTTANIDLPGIEAGSVDLEASAGDGTVRVADLRTTGAADVTGATVELPDADIGTHLTTTASDMTTLGTVASGGGQTHTDGAGDAGRVQWTDLNADGGVRVDVGGDVTGTTFSGQDSLAVHGAAIDITTADTAGGQRYTGDSLAYGTLEAGTWSGDGWGEDGVTRTAGIGATVTGELDGEHTRATGEVAFTAPEIDLPGIEAGSVALDAAGLVTLGTLDTRGAAVVAGDEVVLPDAGIGTRLVTRAGTATTLGEVESGGGQRHTDAAGATGDVTWDELTAGGDVTVAIGGDVAGTAFSGDAGLSLAATGVDLERVQAGSLDIDAVTVEADRMTVAQDADLAAVRDLAIFELLDTGGDLAVDVGGRWTFATLRSGGDIAAESGGATRGGEVQADGTAFFRAGYAGDAGAVARARGAGDPAGGESGLTLAGLTAERARLHTDGRLDMPAPDLARGIELRVDTVPFDRLQADGGRFEVDLANADGGRLDHLSLAVDGADHLAFDHLYTEGGRVRTDSARVDFDRAWITGELALSTADVDMLVKNDAAEMVAGYDAQLYAAGDRFWLKQDGTVTETSALILHAMDTEGGKSAEGMSGDQLARMVAERPASGGGAMPSIELNLHCTGPLPSLHPALQPRIDCLPTSVPYRPGHAAAGGGDGAGI